MRPEASVENGIVLQYNDSGFDRVKRASAAHQDGPSCGQSALASRLACFDGFVGNVPRTAMNNQGGFHRLRLRRMAGAAELCLEGGLNKKVEEYQNGTQHHQAGCPAITASRNAAQGSN